MFQSSLKSKKPLQAKLLGAVENHFGFRPKLILLTRSELSKAIELNPFGKATSDPKSLHFFFLNEPPCDPDLSAIEAMLVESESCSLVDAVFYLHAPNGISRSKVAANAERKLGVVVTARNYNTVQKLSQISNVN